MSECSSERDILLFQIDQLLLCIHYLVSFCSFLFADELFLYGISYQKTFRVEEKFPFLVEIFQSIFAHFPLDLLPAVPNISQFDPMSHLALRTGSVFFREPPGRPFIIFLLFDNSLVHLDAIFAEQFLDVHL